MVPNGGRGEGHGLDDGRLDELFGLIGKELRHIGDLSRMSTPISIIDTFNIRSNE